MRRDEDLATNLIILEAWVESRSVQFSGSSNVVNKQVETTAIWDIDTTVNSALGQLEYAMFFVADTQKAPFVSFHPQILINNVPFDGTGDIVIDMLPGFSVYGAFTSSVDFEKSGGCSLQFFRDNTADFNLKIKVLCEASDAGSITIERVR